MAQERPTLDGYEEKSSCGASGPFGAQLTRRELLQGAATVGGAFALGPLVSACGGGTSASPTPTGSAIGGPKKGGVLKSGIGAGSAADSLDAQVAVSIPEVANSWQLYNRLIELSPDNKLVNMLAEEVSANADASVWTVRLKPGLLFSDGRPVTADDVMYSINRIINPKAPKDGASTLNMLKPTGIKKIDNRTVQFTLETPTAIFPESLAYRENNIVPSGYDPKAGVGTGPFKLKSFTPGQQTVLVPNEHWFGEGPYVDQLTLVQFADPTARINALLSGVIDHCTQVEGSQVPIVQGASGYGIWESKSGGWKPFTMRMDQKPFNDVRVRQAFRLIVDRPQMLQQAYGGHGWIGNDMYAPYDAGYPKDLPQRVQDLAQAKSLLKQAGYDNNLTVELVTSTAVGTGGVEMATVFAEQAKGAGVTVKLNKVDPSVFFGKNYTSWTFAESVWATRDYLLQTTQSGLPGAPYNETHWKNAEWLSIVKAAFVTLDEAKRNELIAEAEKIEYEQGGDIIWAFDSLLDGYSKKLGGLVHDVAQLSAVGFRYDLLYFK
jgi:peptide/nickel transport system substrate-binding protein